MKRLNLWTQLRDRIDCPAGHELFAVLDINVSEFGALFQNGLEGSDIEERISDGQIHQVGAGGSELNELSVC